MPSNPKFIDVRQGLKQVLMQVQKPARYTGGAVAVSGATRSACPSWARRFSTSF